MRSTMMAGLLGLAAIGGCGDGGPGAVGHVDVAMTTDAANASASGSGVLLADTYTDSGGNTLVVSSVQVVIRKVKLEGSGGMCGDDDEPELPDSLEGHDPMDIAVFASDSGEIEGDDDCGVIRAGPMLVDLPLNGGVEHQFTATIDTGTYSQVQLQIHAPDGAADQAFLAAHPDFAGVSIKVDGTYNGTPFTFTTGVTDVQQVEFDPPIVVTEGTTSFTVRVDLSGWFRTEAGALIDPAAVAGDLALKAQVNANIVRSFHGFEDEDHDGHPDD